MPKKKHSVAVPKIGFFIWHIIFMSNLKLRRFISLTYILHSVNFSFQNAKLLVLFSNTQKTRHHFIEAETKKKPNCKITFHSYSLESPKCFVSKWHCQFHVKFIDGTKYWSCEKKGTAIIIWRRWVWGHERAKEQQKKV